MRDPGEFAPPQRLLPEPSPATPVPTRKRYKYIMEWIAKSRTRNRTSSLAETLASRHSLALPDASLRHRRCEVPLYLSGKSVYQDLELLKREITELQSESKAGMPKGSL